MTDLFPVDLHLKPCPVPGCHDGRPEHTDGDDPLVWCSNKYCGLHGNAIPASVWQGLVRRSDLRVVQDKVFEP
jgi:hypothetical protein